MTSGFYYTQPYSTTDAALLNSVGLFQTFILGRVNKAVEAPVFTAAGHLHYVELSHTSFTLEQNKRRQPPVAYRAQPGTIVHGCTCSHHVDVLHIDKDQRSAAVSVLQAGMCGAAVVRRRLHVQGAAGADKDRVAQHAVTWREGKKEGRRVRWRTHGLGQHHERQTLGANVLPDFVSSLCALIVEEEIDFVDSLLVRSSEPQRQLGGFPGLEHAAIYGDVYHTAGPAEILR